MIWFGLFIKDEVCMNDLSMAAKFSGSDLSLNEKIGMGTFSLKEDIG